LSELVIRALNAHDREWLPGFITQRWGAVLVVAHGQIFHPAKLPGFAATQGEELVGVATYAFEGDDCEIITIDSLRPGQGIGTELIRSVKSAAAGNLCRRLWLITTNDNMNALRFYQKQGFVLVKVNRNAIEASRKYKPIPALGLDGIPLRDEIELEMPLNR
jgi:ribosomal protein S18 acetylase RimI-like enzyme